MPVPEEHRIKWEAEVAKALLVWTNGRDTAETLENDYSDGIIDIDEVWDFFEGNIDALETSATPELQDFLLETLADEYFLLQEPTPRIASRYLKKAGLDKFG